MIGNEPRVESGRTIRQFVGFFIAVATLLGTAVVFHYRVSTEIERNALNAGERLNVALGAAAIAEELESVVSDVLYLARHSEHLARYEKGSRSAPATLAGEFKTFIEQKRIYDQIRVLDPSGLELLRVNYNNGQPEIVPKHKLQDKADRYYVAEALAMERGHVYISPLDLNVEAGQVEQPAKPMIRVATPVFDLSRSKSGILLVNYFGERLLVKFRRAAANITDRVMLLNSQGYWLSSPRREDEWGFMFGREHSFANSHPDMWQHISRGDSGQLEDDAGMYTFRTVYPMRSSAAFGGQVDLASAPRGQWAWKVVSLVPANALNAVSDTFVRRHLPLYGLILALLGIGTFLLARATIRHRSVAAQAVFERRFREILENVDLLAVGLDTQGRIVFVNDALLRISGWKREQIADKDWFTLFVPADQRTAAKESFMDAITGERKMSPYTGELQTAVGASRTVSWNDTLLFDSEDRVVGLTSIGEDISDAVQTEEQLRKVSQAVEQSPSSVVITDSQGSIEYVNPKFTDLTGYSLEEVLGKNPRILKSDNLDREDYNKLWDAITSGEEWHGMFHNHKKNGDPYWEMASIKGIRSESGEITHFIAVKEDITERVALEKKARLFFESAPNAMLLVDNEGKIVMVNDEMERCFGYRQDELIGNPVEMLIPESIHDNHCTLRAEFMAENTARQMGQGRELYAVRKDGSQFPVEIGLNPISTEEGRFVLSAVVDITKRKMLEAELAMQHREIAHNETLAAVGRMANMVAHDLRNPLSSIKMGLQILDKKKSDGNSLEQQELKQIALEQVSYMEQILEDLLSYSRPGSLNPEWLNIDKVIEPAIILAQKQIDESNVHVTVWCQPGLPTLHGDNNRLRQAFTNLIANAAQATEGISDRPSEISILAQLDLHDGKPYIRVEVCDNGRGIRSDETDKLFEPFFTTRTSGSGLGLSIAKRIIDQHHGSLRLRPNVNAGTCAIVSLPTGPIEDVKQPAILKAEQAGGTMEQSNQPLVATKN